MAETEHDAEQEPGPFDHISVGPPTEGETAEAAALLPYGGDHRIPSLLETVNTDRSAA